MLTEMQRTGSDEAWARAALLKARVRFDREEYSDAREIIGELLARAPDMDEASLLEAEISLRMKRLEDATDVVIGPSMQQSVLVPGRPLRISMGHGTTDAHVPQCAEAVVNAVSQLRKSGRQCCCSR